MIALFMQDRPQSPILGFYGEIGKPIPEDPPLAQGHGSRNISMPVIEINKPRQTLYNDGSFAGHRTNRPELPEVEWSDARPGKRQQIFSSKQWSTWQDLRLGNYRSPEVDKDPFATRASLRDRTNINRAKTRPIRLWDMSSYPASVPPSAYIPNPAQLSQGQLVNQYSQSPTFQSWVRG